LTAAKQAAAASRPAEMLVGLAVLDALNQVVKRTKKEALATVQLE
jgi:hypothetical protein